MTNLDSILKSRDITLPKKVHLVKAMVFPVVMCGCESWTTNKAECRRIDTFERSKLLQLAMVFPVVKYGCESWTVKQAECQIIEVFELCGVGEDS